METTVANFMKYHHVRLENKTILVGVSGGPDSMALLHMLSSRLKERNMTIIAIAIDHQLRGEESRADVEYVENKCREWGIPFVPVQLDVQAFSTAKKVSTQVAARELRYRSFQQLMEKYGAHFLALGHHGDDQIETLVMSLMRAANATSFIGIPFRRPFSGGEIIRPFLCVTKKEIIQYCQKYRIHPRIDPSNEDVCYTRNYVRKYIVPKLVEKNNRLHITVERLNESLLEDELYLLDKAKQAFAQIVHFHEKENEGSIEIGDVYKLPVSLQRRLFRLTLDYLYHKKLPKNLSHKHEEAFLSIIQPNSQNKLVHLPNRLVMERSYSTILFYFYNQNEERTYFYKEIETIPTDIFLPNGALLSVTYTDLQSVDDIYSFIYPAEQVNFPLYVRTRKHGDRMRYKGLQGSKKIKDIFIDEKVPRYERERTYIISDSKDEILWLIGLRKGLVSSNLNGKRKHILFTYHSNNTFEGESNA